MVSCNILIERLVDTTRTEISYIDLLIGPFLISFLQSPVIYDLGKEFILSAHYRAYTVLLLAINDVDRY